MISFFRVKSSVESSERESAYFHRVSNDITGIGIFFLAFKMVVQVFLRGGKLP